jgi:hypothetical protein
MDQRSDAVIDPRPGRLRLALAARAEADSLRARRAERLARIRAGGAPDQAPDQEPVHDILSARAEGGAAPEREPASAPEVDAEPSLPLRDVDALERFLADLVGTIDTDPVPPQPARVAPTRLAPVLPLARSTQPGGDAADLARLPGAGPGLVGALIRSGVPDLAALAGLGREALGERLGPLARLIDLDGWLAFARAATRRTAPAPQGPTPRDLAG